WRAAAAAGGGVVKPVDLALGNFSWRIEFTLNPFLSALVVPPGEARDGVIVGIAGNAPVRDRANRVILISMRGGNLERQRLGRHCPLMGVQALTNDGE